MKAELLFKAGVDLAEGPVWHQDALWWVDIPTGRLNRFDPAAGRNETKTVAQMLGAALPAKSGRWLLADQDGLVLFDWATGDTRRVSDVIGHDETIRFNDGKTGPAGAFWGGTMGTDGRDGAGTFYRFAGAGPIEAKFAGVTCSNGLDFSADGKTFYYVDTGTKRLDCFDLDTAAGTLSNRRTLVDLNDEGLNPDGLTLDAEGNVWLALWGGFAVRCYDGQTGAQLAAVELPAEQVTSCCFGGEDLKTMYITTASYSGPEGGHLFTCRPGVAGRRPYLFDDSAFG